MTREERIAEALARHDPVAARRYLEGSGRRRKVEQAATEEPNREGPDDE